MKIALIFLLATMTCPTCNRDWRKKDNKPDLWDSEWDYVCVPTGRLDDAQVTLYKSTYEVWSRGGKYGEYATLEQAKKQGETIVVQRKLDCAAAGAPDGK